jgi:hypothetical protein
LAEQWPPTRRFLFSTSYMKKEQMAHDSMGKGNTGNEWMSNQEMKK